jgi:hypothetical protein
VDCLALRYTADDTLYLHVFCHVFNNTLRLVTEEDEVDLLGKVLEIRHLSLAFF